MSFAGHGAIIGMTGSGKTFLAQRLARAMRQRGRNTVALTLDGERWPADAVTWQTSRPAAMLAALAKNRNCVAFLEIADAEVEKTDLGFVRLFTKGRHAGHQCFYLSQRAAFVNPAIRENCAQLFLFTVDGGGVAAWAKSFNDPLIYSAPSLPRYQFIHKPDRWTPGAIRTLTV